MNYKKINNITGWAVCLIACTVYLMTMEASGSLWDCGEFASSAYKLQNPHPPGAPLFVLIGRLFMIPFGPQNAVRGLNAMSALASGFTILFLFWNITHFGRKILLKRTKELNMGQIVTVMAAGVIGALAYTFSDSFWYSAVEGEVYALSSFFTAIVFWAILRWEQAVTDEHAAGITGKFTKADKWLILIFYLMGLSIGVHLLNLLTLPAIVMVYYFKRYKATVAGSLVAFITAIAITGFVQVAVIKWSIKWASDMDIFFVNDLGMPFFMGFTVFFLIISAILFVLIKVAGSNNWNYLKLGAWSFSFMLLGYMTYLTPLIRSNANTSIDMYNVDNPVSLYGYVGREQYGDWPILAGQYFTESPNAPKASMRISYELKAQYIKTKDGYDTLSHTQVPVLKTLHLFPRLWNGNETEDRVDFYASWCGIKDTVQQYENDQGELLYYGPDGIPDTKVTKFPVEGNYWNRNPTFDENLSYFFGYQLNWMYVRYFMWNFAGKQNDIASSNPSNVRDGNWISGIGFIDNLRLGDQNMMPDTMKNNKANNKLYMLPLLLGLAGLAFQLVYAKKDAVVSSLLFFFTGIAIILYLNQAGNQPRERDYAFVGSFYAFAIWIGLGAMLAMQLLNKFIKKPIFSVALAGSVCFIAVPGNMAYQEWDDHDRSNKTIARDLAKDYLESCPPNAILVTFGDNDTYPLWYAQEVEGIRPDVRVINNSLLGADWNINQLRYRINDSDSVDLVWEEEKIAGDNRNQIAYYPTVEGLNDQSMDLYTLLKDYAGNDKFIRDFSSDPKRHLMLCTYPTQNVSLPVDSKAVYASKIVDPKETFPNAIQFQLPESIVKNDAAVLNIIAANKWKRPICFTSPYNTLGFGSYLRQNGMTYVLTPIAHSGDNFNTVQPEVVKQLLNFGSGNASKKGVYFDEENRRHLLTIRSTFATAALAFTGKQNATKADTLIAQQLLEKCDQLIDQSNAPYGLMSDFQRHNYTSMMLYVAAKKANAKAIADKIITSLETDYLQQKAYYQSLSSYKREPLNKIEIPYLVNMFINSQWSIDTVYDSKGKQLLIDCKKVKDSSDLTNNRIPMPYVIFNNGTLQCFTGSIQFETTIINMDFENIAINFKQALNASGEEIGYKITGMVKNDPNDLILDLMKKVNGYKFENHFEQLILTCNNKPLFRLTKKF